MTKAELLTDLWEQAGGTILTASDTAGNHKASCPFHEDRNPSASVNQDEGLFNCFSCGRSGDVYSFIQEQQGLDFPDAARIVESHTGENADRKTSTGRKPKAYRPSWL